METTLIDVVFKVMNGRERVGFLGPTTVPVAFLPVEGDSVYLAAEHPYYRLLGISAGSPGRVLRKSHGLGYEGGPLVTVFVAASAAHWPPIEEVDITTEQRWMAERESSR
jgi:hypothetical protein